jgi:hypothetical protein
MLSDFADARPTHGGCNRCAPLGGGGVNPTHFLSCMANQSFRTNRHTAVSFALYRRMRDAHGSNAVDREKAVGQITSPDGTSETVRSDISATVDGTRYEYDVGITGERKSMSIPTWPTKEEVIMGMEKDAKERAEKKGDALFHWEDLHAEEVHPTHTYIRVMREMAFERSVNKLMLEVYRREKINHYRKAGATVAPLIFTANGACSKEVRYLVKSLVKEKHPRTRAMYVFRSFLLGQVSVCLLKFAQMMHATHVVNIPVGLSNSLPIPLTQSENDSVQGLSQDPASQATSTTVDLNVESASQGSHP